MIQGIENHYHTMEQFKNRQNGFKEIQKAMVLKAIPFSLIVVLAGLAIVHFNTNNQENDVTVYPFVIPIALGALVFGLFSGIKRQKKIFESYTLTIDNDGITRKQDNTPSITITTSEIREIIKYRNGSFLVKGNSPKDSIIIPSQIEERDKLEKILSEIKEISTKQNEALAKNFQGLLTLITLVLMGALYLSKNKMIVGISGTVLLSILGYSFFEIRRNKNIDNKSKKGIWALVLTTIAILGIMYYKLLGNQ